MINRQHVPAGAAALFNRFGGGLVHMGLFLAEEPAPSKLLPSEIKRLLMGTRIVARTALGVLTAPTIVASGAGADFQAVDGLDCTVDQDGDTFAVAYSFHASFSANPGVLKVAVKLDGNQITPDIHLWTYTGTAVFAFSGFYALNVGAGSHRFQLVITTANAVTVTLTGTNRVMRVAGLLAQS